MGHWDELCLICGISPIPPSELWTDAYFGIEQLCEQLIACDASILQDLEIDEEELCGILHQAVDAEPSYHLSLDKTAWHWKHFEDAFAIGHFVTDEDAPHELVKLGTKWMRKIPDGVGVETRVVRDPNCGEFQVVVHRTPGQGGSEATIVEETRLSRTSSSNYLYSEISSEDGFGNFWVSEGCFHYLQAWIDFARLPAASHNRKLSFSGELYEVVNSRETGRNNGVGTLEWMNYDDIDKTLDQTQYDYHGGLQKPTNILAAIRRGAPSNEIHSAVIQDFRCWMFYSPDIWPTAPGSYGTDDPTNHGQNYTYFNDTSDLTSGLGHLALLPPDILTEFLSWLPDLKSYLALSRTSRMFFNSLTNTSTFNRVLRRMSKDPSRCLYWLRPVNALDGEVVKANEALFTWYNPSANDTQLESASPLDDVKFPWVGFIRACHNSDSMRNRQRIWGQIKQVEHAWRDYRINGWRVDRFGVPLTSID